MSSDDPYPSLQPVVNAIAGFFIATFTLILPLYSVTFDGVKLNRKDVASSRATGARVEMTTQLNFGKNYAA